MWTGWGLSIFEELLDKSLVDFVEELTAAGTGIKVAKEVRLASVPYFLVTMVPPSQIKARRHYLKNYGRCFAGAKSVDWCMKNNKSPSRADAIVLMDTLLQKGSWQSSFLLRSYSAY